MPSLPERHHGDAEMKTLSVRIGTMADAKARFVGAANRALAGKAVEASPTLNFACYDDMHRVLSPSRLAIVRVLVGQGAVSICETARRIGRDVQAVHRDVTTLANAGVIERTEGGIGFPYDTIRFEFDLSAAV
jgi:predicted transcriptional regulator